jgi:hypothetical protein
MNESDERKGQKVWQFTQLIVQQLISAVICASLDVRRPFCVFVKVLNGWALSIFFSLLGKNEKTVLVI